MAAKNTAGKATAQQTAQGPGGKQILMLLMAVGLASILIGSLVYRVGHPSLDANQHEAKHTGASGASMGGDSSMEMIRALMAKLEENPNDVHVLHTLGEQFIRMKAWDRAKALLERGLGVEPSNKQILRLLGIVEFNMQQYHKAAEMFETVISLEPHDYMSHYNLGILYGHFLDQKDKAREHLQQVVDSEEASDQSRMEARQQLESLSK